MEQISDALGAVGKAAEFAGELGGKAYDLAKRVNMSGVKNAASEAYQTAKNLTRNVNIGRLGTRAVNAARTFKNTVARSVNPQVIANSAAKAASVIGEAARGAGSTVAQVGATIRDKINIGRAARVAGELGGKAYNLAKGIQIPAGIKSAASKAYETAKQLKNSIPIGSIGTRALNAARSFKNTVARSVNPQTIANSASKAASVIGQAAQGAGDKISQLGSAIGSSSVWNKTRKAWNSTAGIRGAAGNMLKGVGSRAGAALQGLGRGLMAPSPYGAANPFYRRTVLDDVMNKRIPGSLASSINAAQTSYLAPQAPRYYPPVAQAPALLNVDKVYANMNANKQKELAAAATGKNTARKSSWWGRGGVKRRGSNAGKQSYKRKRST